MTDVGGVRSRIEVIWDEPPMRWTPGTGELVHDHRGWAVRRLPPAGSPPPGSYAVPQDPELVEGVRLAAAWFRQAGVVGPAAPARATPEGDQAERRLRLLLWSLDEAAEAWAAGHRVGFSRAVGRSLSIVDDIAVAVGARQRRQRCGHRVVSPWRRPVGLCLLGCLGLTLLLLVVLLVDGPGRWLAALAMLLMGPTLALTVARAMTPRSPVQPRTVLRIDAVGIVLRPTWFGSDLAVRWIEVRRIVLFRLDALALTGVGVETADHYGYSPWPWTHRLLAPLVPDVPVGALQHRVLAPGRRLDLDRLVEAVRANAPWVEVLDLT